MNGIEAALCGRVGTEPELRTSQAGKPWCSFSAAVGEGDNVQWVRVACFGEIAQQMAASLAKGDRVYVEGTLTLNTWTARDGEQRTGLSVAAWRVDRLGNIGRNRPKTSTAPAASRDYARPAETAPRPARQQALALDGDLPF